MASTARVIEGPTGGWIPDTDTFGARLILLRQKMGWTNLKSAALACGITVQSWRDWESNASQPRHYMQVCEQIAHHTGCDIAWLAGALPGGWRPGSKSEGWGFESLRARFDEADDEGVLTPPVSISKPTHLRLVKG